MFFYRAHFPMLSEGRKDGTQGPKKAPADVIETSAGANGSEERAKCVLSGASELAERGR